MEITHPVELTAEDYFNSICFFIDKQRELLAIDGKKNDAFPVTVNENGLDPFKSALIDTFLNQKSLSYCTFTPKGLIQQSWFMFMSSMKTFFYSKTNIAYKKYQDEQWIEIMAFHSHFQNIKTVHTAEKLYNDLACRTYETYVYIQECKKNVQNLEILYTVSIAEERKKLSKSKRKKIQDDYRLLLKLIQKTFSNYATAFKKLETMPDDVQKFEQSLNDCLDQLNRVAPCYYDINEIMITMHAVWLSFPDLFMHYSCPKNMFVHMKEAFLGYITRNTEDYNTWLAEELINVTIEQHMVSEEYTFVACIDAIRQIHSALSEMVIQKGGEVYQRLKINQTKNNLTYFMELSDAFLLFSTACFAEQKEVTDYVMQSIVNEQKWGNFLQFIILFNKNFSDIKYAVLKPRLKDFFGDWSSGGYITEVKDLLEKVHQGFSHAGWQPLLDDPNIQELHRHIVKHKGLLQFISDDSEYAYDRMLAPLFYDCEKNVYKTERQNLNNIKYYESYIFRKYIFQCVHLEDNYSRCWLSLVQQDRVREAIFYDTVVAWAQERAFLQKDKYSINYKTHHKIRPLKDLLQTIQNNILTSYQNDTLNFSSLNRNTAVIPLSDPTVWTRVYVHFVLASWKRRLAWGGMLFFLIYVVPQGIKWFWYCLPSVEIELKLE